MPETLPLTGSKRRLGAPLRAGLALALGFAGLALLTLTLIGLPVRSTIDPSRMVPVEIDGGKHAYLVRLWRLPPLIPSDGMTDNFASELRLFEDGAPLGPAHGMHGNIAKYGEGRYSHWQGFIYFSTSDNSDPRSNGRTYSYAGRIVLPVEFLLLGLLCLGGMFWLYRDAMSAGMAAASARYPRLGATLKVAAINLALVAGGLVLVAVAAEIYFRLTVPFARSNSQLHFEPSVGFIFVPGTEMKFTNGLDYWSEQRSNSLGFLDREPPAPEAAAASCHVAIIGDSFVEAAQVPIADKLQVRLEEAAARSLPELRITTSAYGYSGTGQLNQLPFYDRFVRALRPKIVVLVFVSNDFANNSSVLEALRNGWDPDHPPRLSATKEDGSMRLQPIDPEWERYNLPRSGGGGTTTDTLARRSLFFDWLRAKAALLWGIGTPDADPQLAEWAALLSERPRYAHLREGWQPTTVADLDLTFFGETLPPVFAEAVDFTGFALDEYKARAERDGARLLILSSHSMREKGDHLFDRLKRLAGERGIPVIDQADYIRTSGHDPGEANYPHDGHWNERGHRWAAEALLAYIAANPQLCAPAPGGVPEPPSPDPE